MFGGFGNPGEQSKTRNEGHEKVGKAADGDKVTTEMLRAAGDATVKSITGFIIRDKYAHLYSLQNQKLLGRWCATKRRTISMFLMNSVVLLKERAQVMKYLCCEHWQRE